MKKLELTFMTRKQVAAEFSITPKTLTKYLEQWEAEILEIDPNYKSRELLKPVTIDFIYKKITGLSRYENLNFEKQNPDNY